MLHTSPSGEERCVTTLKTAVYQTTILDKIKWNSKPPSAPPLKSRMKPREGQNLAIFPSLIWGEGGSRFSIYFVQDCSSMQDRRLSCSSAIQNLFCLRLELSQYALHHHFLCMVTQFTNPLDMFF